jgi:hypothetical protein
VTVCGLIPCWFRFAVDRKAIREVIANCVRNAWLRLPDTNGILLWGDDRVPTLQIYQLNYREHLGLDIINPIALVGRAHGRGFNGSMAVILWPTSTSCRS